VVDEHGALGGVALVVDVERAALAGLGGVVDDGDEVGGDLLAEHAGVDAGALAVEVGLHAVADGLVQEDAGGAGGEHDGQLAGGRALGLEEDHGALDGLLGDEGEALVGVPVEVLAGGEVGGVGLGDAVLLGGDHAPQAGHRAHVGEDLAVHVGDEDQLLAVGPADGDLLDGGVGGAGEGVQLLDARELEGDADLGPRALELVEAALGRGS
jgi:hypothetical protein